MQSYGYFSEHMSRLLSPTTQIVIGLFLHVFILFAHMDDLALAKIESTPTMGSSNRALSPDSLFWV